VKTQFISSMENKEPFKVRFALFHTMKMKSNQTMAARKRFKVRFSVNNLNIRFFLHSYHMTSEDFEYNA